MMEIERSQDLRDGEGSPDMAGLVVLDHAQDIDAGLKRTDCEVPDQLLAMVMHVLPPDAAIE
jgi:hypothetical protein